MDVLSLQKELEVVTAIYTAVEIHRKWATSPRQTCLGHVEGIFLAASTIIWSHRGRGMHDYN